MTAEIIPLGTRHSAQHIDSECEQAAPDERMELRRARIRILQLEASLTSALRDAVQHHNRAQQAELKLRELKTAIEMSIETA